MFFYRRIGIKRCARRRFFYRTVFPYHHCTNSRQMILSCIFSATESQYLSRLEYSLLSQQVLLEMLVEKLHGSLTFQDGKGNYLPIDEWDGVEVNKSGEVEVIDWCACAGAHFEGGGSLRFEFLPPTLTRFYVAHNEIEGTIDLTCLPQSLVELSVSRNKLTGTANLTRLPETIGYLDLDEDYFTTRRKDTSPWCVGPVPQFWGKPRTFSNPLSCFCHGADPIDGHRKVVGQDQYPALGEVWETAKLLPRGESPWWRDKGRHLLILCLFSIHGMR